MKKIIFLVALLPFLSGCVKDVSTTDMMANAKMFPATPVEKSFEGQSRVESHYPGLALLANQVLGTPLTKEFRTRSLNRDIGYDMDEKPLQDELAQSKVTKQLVIVMVSVVEGKKDVDNLKISGKDFHKFISAAFNDIEALYSDPHAKAQIGKMYSTRSITRQGMLFSYVKAYMDGKFVDRAGNIISRPTINSSGVPNATLSGLLNVFLEAFYDYALAGKSPVLMQKDSIVTYTPMFLPDPQSPSIYLQKFRQIKTNNWFTINNNEPTASKFVTVEEVGGDLLPQEVKLIRLASNLAGEKSKALTGIIFRTFGSVNIGMVVFGKFNIGDNETLAKLLDTAFEVSSRRLVELAAYQFFKRYNGSKDFDPLLMGFEKEF